LTINNFGPADAGAYDVVVNDSSATPVVSQIGWIRYQSPAGWLWGSGSKTALGIGDLGRRDTALVIAKDVAEVFAGYWSTFFLKKDGSVWAAGSNWDGQLGVGTENIEPLPLQVGINDVVQIAPGMAHTLFLKRDGSVWAVGVNWYGQLGNNSTTNSRTPVYVTGDATQISAGYLHSACLKRDGSLWVWGRNEAGQLGDVTSTDSLVPIQVATEVRQISAGAFSTVFIKNDNTLWGMGEWAQSSYPSSPAVAPLDSGVESVAADSWRLLYIKTGGQLWHRSGIGNFNSSNLVDTGVNKVVSHGWGTTSAYSKTDGTVFAYGVARGTASLPAPGSAIASNAASIACGEGYLLYLTADGLLWSVGSYSQGQLGDGHTVAQPTPAHLLSGVVDTATSENSSFALLADGSLWGMGQNSSGQLGDGTTADRAYPVKISTGVATISAGQSHTLYIDISNTLWACGSNNSGQLGNGTSDYLPNSIPISVAADVVACAAGYNHSLFLKRDGTLMAMGNNGNGQLNGVLDGKPYNSPTTVASDVAACAAGSSHSLFLKRDGTLMAMGFNGYGQIGDGTTNFSTPPVTVASDVVACAAGYGHSLFLKRDGTLMAMGFNGNGQLGDGTTANRTTPVAIATGVVAISAGSNHSLFLKTDGSLWAMGGNYYGAFGDGTVLNHLLPMQIANNIGGLAAGGFHSLFIQKPIAATAPVITSQPSSMSLLLGSKLQLSVSATGTGPLDYQWYKDGVAIPGERSPQLSIGFLNASDFGQYTVVVTNQSSAVPSQAAVITQGIPPAITTQPVDSTIALGAATTLTVVANGTPPISYQWYKGDSGDTTQPIAGATTASYTTPALSAWSRYWVRISSKSFYTDSRTAFVKVNGGTMTVKDWTAHLGVPTGKGGALDIPASDGVTNLIKFALGVAPMDNASSHLPFPTTYAAAPGEPKQLALVFTLNPSAQGIRYVLEVSADASNWTEAESVTDVLRTNPDGTKLVRMREAAPPAATRRFARLRIEAMPF
jgi:alpha-tubulin suppressor-like RCC1 family protein